MIHLGIDPGASGGLAVIYPEKVTAINCPPTVSDMADEIISLEGYRAALAVIEAVHSFPDQGVASTFKFGLNYGQWLGILAALGIPYVQVTPGKWMKHFGAMPKDKTARKNHLKHLAQNWSRCSPKREIVVTPNLTR